MSDLLFPIFLIPWDIQSLYINSWLIGGPLGQVLCSLVNFLPRVSLVVTVRSLVLVAVDRFGAVVFPLRSPLISLNLLNIQEGRCVRWVGRLIEAFGETSSYDNYLLPLLMIFNLIPFILYIIIYIKLKSQKIPGEQSANAGQQRQQRERNVLKMAIAIVLGFAVCGLPFFIFKFLSIFVSDIRSCGFQIFAIFMVRINCAMNPCICLIFSRNYREGVKTLFR